VVAEHSSSDAVDAQDGSTGRVRHTVSGWRRLLKIVYRDPENVCERLELYMTQTHGADSSAWADRVREDRKGVPRAAVAEDLRIESARVAAIDGAVSGTPYLIALVPGYLAYIRQQGRMLLRTAALYDRDPRALETAAELLALRGVHPTVDAARSALVAVRDVPMPEKPAARRPWRTWVSSIYELGVLGGFLSAPTDKRKTGAHAWLKTAIGALFGLVVFVITWVFPFTFMISMGWGCDSSTRALGQRALTFYDTKPGSAQAAIAAAKQQRETGRNRRQVVRAALLVLSVAIPIAFISVVVEEHQSVGITPLTAVGALLALGLVITTTTIATRR
jgi:hypothetical protein